MKPAELRRLVGAPIVTDRPRCDLGARIHAELAQEVADVRVGRTLSDDQLSCDLTIGQTTSNQGRDLALARSEGSRVPLSFTESVRWHRGLQSENREARATTCERSCGRPVLPVVLIERGSFSIAAGVRSYAS